MSSINMGPYVKRVLYFLITPFIFFSINIPNARHVHAQATSLSVTKQVDKAHVQRDDPNDRNITYTLTVNVDGYCNAPLDIALLFDRSNSMNEPPENPPIELAKDATISFINQLDAATDRVSLTTYQTTANLDIPLTNDFQTVETFIDSIVAEGFTNIGDALTFARNDIIANQRGVVEVMILFTDGVWNRGPDPELIAQSIKDNDSIRIISVGIGPSADQLLLQNIASSADDFYYVENPSDLEATLIDIARNLQYGDTHIVLTDNISEILEFTEFVEAHDGGVLENGTIVWDLGDDICGGTSFTTQFIVRVKDDTPDLTPLLNNAIATDISTQLQVQSNQVSTIVHAPILSLDKIHTPEDIIAGSIVNYQIILKNSGTGNAYAVVIEDTLPSLFLSVIEDSISDNGQFTGNSIIWDGDGNGIIINGSFSPQSGPNVLDSEHILSYQGIVSLNVTPSTQLVNSVRLTSESIPDTVFEDTDIVILGDVLAATGEGKLAMWIGIGLLLMFSPLTVLVSKRYFVKNSH